MCFAWLRCVLCSLAFNGGISPFDPDPQLLPPEPLFNPRTSRLRPSNIPIDSRPTRLPGGSGSGLG